MGIGKSFFSALLMQYFSNCFSLATSDACRLDDIFDLSATLPR